MPAAGEIFKQIALFGLELLSIINFFLAIFRAAFDAHVSPSPSQVS